MTDLKRAAAWILALTMIVSCIPGFALRARAEETVPAETVAEEPEALEATGEPAEATAVPIEETTASTEETVVLIEEEPTGAEMTEETTLPTEAAPEPSEETTAPTGEAVSAAAVEAAEFGDGLSWSFDEETGALTISGTGSMGVMGYEDQPWADCSETVTAVTIGRGVTDIAAYAFARCGELTSAVIPDTVKAIGAHAFYGCRKLKNLELPEGLTSLGAAAFFNCESLTVMTIPEGITELGSYAFQNCTSLAEISLPDALAVIGSSAFTNCTALTEITIPDSVTVIKGGAFGGCTGLTRIEIPSGVTRLEGHTFYGCVELTDVILPDGITYIGIRAFFDCSSLVNIRIPKAVNGIDYRAFTDCISLREIRFTGDAPDFDGKAFEGLTTTCVYPAENPTWTPAVMQDYAGSIDWVPDSERNVPVPQKPYKIANVISGVHVYWKQTEGISRYGLWRSGSGAEGSYKLIDTTAALHYLDTTAQSGTEYHYKLTAIDPATGLHSEMTEALGILFVGTPDLTLRVNRAVGIGLGWPRISGAEGYAVYRKSYSGGDAWVRVATIRDGETTTWDDTSVKTKNGQVYRYTVRALAGEDLKTLSGCHGNGRTMVRLTSLTMSSVEQVDWRTVRCVWSTTTQATGYEVRFMADGEVFATHTIGSNQTGAKTFRSLEFGQTYKVQVRSYKKVDGVGSFYSAWSMPEYVTISW